MVFKPILIITSTCYGISCVFPIWKNPIDVSFIPFFLAGRCWNLPPSKLFDNAHYTVSIKIEMRFFMIFCQVRSLNYGINSFCSQSWSKCFYDHIRYKSSIRRRIYSYGKNDRNQKQWCYFKHKLQFLTIWWTFYEEYVKKMN